MIFNSQGQVVLQQRSLNKTSQPGKRDMPWWHHAAGHTIEQTAAQELMEEMWISTDLSLQRIGLYLSDTQAEYYYLYYGICDGPFGYDSNEVAAIHSFDCQKLLAGLYDADYEILKHVKTYTEELRFVRKSLVSHKEDVTT
jgi:isopentenyldiphosphate isomerase